MNRMASADVLPPRAPQEGREAMPLFVKKPPVFEAEQFDGTVDSATRLSLRYASNVYPDFDGENGDHWTGRMIVNTPDGRRYANAGDWIVNGPDGRYLCEPDIFAATYEPA